MHVRFESFEVTLAYRGSAKENFLALLLSKLPSIGPPDRPDENPWIK